MKIWEINFFNVDKTLKSPEYKNIIYGAGHNGEYILKLLEQQGVLVTAFYDDDRQRGNNYCGKTILSETELRLLAPGSTNIIISSMYIPQIYQKCRKLGFERIFVALERILEKDTADFQFAQYANEEYIGRLDRLGHYFKQDTLSQKYFAVIKKAVLAGRAVKDIVELYCGEKQYFLNCFQGKLHGLNFIDAGAYTGDTFRELVAEGITCEKVICFEADKENYEKLIRCCSGINQNVIVENKALWNQNTMLGMKFGNYNARIDMQSNKKVVEAVTIDSYVKIGKIDFIKMDIEGAEQRALIGGMGVITRDRPILAISIYHGMEDIVEIPEMLISKLVDYKYIIRHHSYTYSETVMYCVPCERADIELR